MGLGRNARFEWPFFWVSGFGATALQPLPLNIQHASALCEVSYGEYLILGCSLLEGEGVQCPKPIP